MRQWAALVVCAVGAFGVGFVMFYLVSHVVYKGM